MTARQRKRRIKQMSYIGAVYEGGALDLYWRCPCGYCRQYRKSRSVVKWR